MAREDTGGPLLLISTTVVCLSDFFTFARAFWVWISSHAFVLPATLDSRPQTVHSDIHTPIWAVGYTAVPGRREQGTSGHDRALGCGRVAVTVPHIPGLHPMGPPPSHPGLLSCLQLRRSLTPPHPPQGCMGARQGHPGHPSQTATLGSSRSSQNGHLCRTIGRGLGTVQVPEGRPPQAGKALASLDSVPSVSGHGGHSQSPGPGSPERRVLSGPCWGLWGCAARSGWGLQPPSIRPGPPQGGPWLLCVCPSALGVPTAFERPVQEPRRGPRWLPAPAATLVYYTVLISNFSLFKRTLKTLFLTLVLCKACSLCEGWGGARAPVSVPGSCRPTKGGRQGASSRSGP